MSEMLEVLRKAIDEKKGERTIIYEFSSLNPFIDHVIITEASNLRQVYAIASNIVDRMKELTDYREFEVDYEIDEQLIGGLVLRLDDRVIDSSIRTKLQTMGKSLSKIQL